MENERGYTNEKKIEFQICFPDVFTRIGNSEVGLIKPGTELYISWIPVFALADKFVMMV